MTKNTIRAKRSVEIFLSANQQGMVLTLGVLFRNLLTKKLGRELIDYLDRFQTVFLRTGATGERRHGAHLLSNKAKQLKEERVERLEAVEVSQIKRPAFLNN
ncbi:hypothetical protein [Pedobacter sp. SYSU D00535]|uniref:hypothetical protein n=1 Tax=Pedobacter sp. SYSU D00535 TaxID=2810308 RepID=UPI001A978FE9|nr:hypothetical protein [Pedobacter sp. SYSU D00535]